MEKYEAVEKTLSPEDADKQETQEFITEEAHSPEIPNDSDNSNKITDLEKQISETFDRKNSPSLNTKVVQHEILQEISRTESPPPSEIEKTFLERHPKLAKWSRSIMFAAGLGIAVPAANAAGQSNSNKTSSSQIIGTGSGVAEWSGDETITTKTISPEKNHSQKKEVGSGIKKKSAPKSTEVETTVIMNGEEISTSSSKADSIVGAEIVDGGKSIIVNGKKIEKPKNSSVEVNQKAKSVTGSIVGVEIK